MNEVLINLKEKLLFINTLIKDKSDVVYFDYPLHCNVGDLLIYHGTKKFFKDNNINIRLERSVRSFNLSEAKKIITPNTTILCHGGGNFGDLYGICQRLRETLIQEFPNNRIIVLPQTVFFSNEKLLYESAEVFQKHSDCHLFARDTISGDLMKQFSDNVYLSPDMAHQLYNTFGKYSNRHNGKTLYFIRKDAEKSTESSKLMINDNDEQKDWSDITTPIERIIANCLWFSSEVFRRTKLYFFNDLINKLWFSYTQKIIARSEKQFLSYQSIVTDRLHGHIFSCLLEIPHKVLDNSYGKNSSYYTAWTKDIDFAEKNG